MLRNNTKSYGPFSLWLHLTTLPPEFLLHSPKLAYLNAVIAARLNNNSLHWPLKNYRILEVSRSHMVPLCKWSTNNWKQRKHYYQSNPTQKEKWSHFKRRKEFPYFPGFIFQINLNTSLICFSKLICHLPSKVKFCYLWL